MKPKKVKILSSENAAYIAGIIDGEGTITLIRRNKGQNRRLSLTISNNDMAILAWIKKTVGVGVMITKRTYGKKHFPSFTYSISNTQAYNLIEVIVPYLRGFKKLRARIVLKNYHQLTPRNGKYTVQILAKREEFIKNFFSLKTATVRVFDSLKV